MKGWVKGFGFTSGQAGSDGWDNESDPNKCPNCDGDIGLTDVEGHYTGICKKCRIKHSGEYQEAMKEEFGGGKI